MLEYMVSICSEDSKYILSRIQTGTCETSVAGASETFAEHSSGVCSGGVGSEEVGTISEERGLVTHMVRICLAGFERFC
jgi:hypothetical protein